MSLEQQAEHHILYLILNRPVRANCLNPPTIVALRQAFLDTKSR
ncbi:MAG: hypothetical protein ACFE9D_05875 [Promethearchaeota archaeon]